MNVNKPETLDSFEMFSAFLGIRGVSTLILMGTVVQMLKGSVNE